MTLPVYNLEFRPNSVCMEIGAYTFTPVANYREQLGLLQHLVESHGWGGSTRIQTGTHAQTATVDIPSEDQPSVIRWPNSDASALDDIVLLLSLFTQRNVFTYTPTDEFPEPAAIIADPRMYKWGGTLTCSLPFERGGGNDPDEQHDATFEIHLPEIYARIGEQEWQATFNGGYYLVLANQAMQQHRLESAFGQCWTIWEHLFACLTDSWMSPRTVRQFNSKEKIAFLLVHFGVRVALATNEKTRLDDLVAIRNRLIHFGQFPVGDTIWTDALMFIRMTEYIVAKSLGLHPSNVFNTIERFEEFLADDETRGR